MTEKQTQTITHDGFLLPDLCEYQALFVLIIVSQLVALVLVVTYAGLYFDWVQFGMMSLYIQLQAVCSAIPLCKLRLYLNTLSKYKAASLAYILLLIIGFLLGILAEWQYAPIQQRYFDWHNVFRNLLITAILAGIALRYLYLHQQLINREKSELMANLSALQARIKPHFLFNTMNSIASLITIEPEKAEKMVEDLAELLRASLRDNVVETSIAEEWRICEKYLEIEQLRLGDRLHWQCDFSKLDQQLSIPSLSLQPLIENAIYHGIQPSPTGGYMKIIGESHNNKVFITVENSQAQQHQAGRENKGNKMAINNIRHRIQQLYGDSASLDLQDNDSSFLVSLSYTLKE